MRLRPSSWLPVQTIFLGPLDRGIVMRNAFVLRFWRRCGSVGLRFFCRFLHSRCILCSFFLASSWIGWLWVASNRCDWLSLATSGACFSLWIDLFESCLDSSSLDSLSSRPDPTFELRHGILEFLFRCMISSSVRRLPLREVVSFMSSCIERSGELPLPFLRMCDLLWDWLEYKQLPCIPICRSGNWFESMSLGLCRDLNDTRLFFLYGQWSVSDLLPLLFLLQRFSKCAICTLGDFGDFAFYSADLG